jgi:glutamate-5-semialdehyde dehydrogenase
MTTIASSVQTEIYNLVNRTKLASIELSRATSVQKDLLLKEISIQIQNDKDQILEANKKDISNANPKDHSSSFLDRLKLDEDRLHSIIKNIKDVLSLKDPVGIRELLHKRPNGLDVYRQTIPLGLIGIIYESRPNVTSDAAVLCLKSGNTTILRGGSECFETNKALVVSIKKALVETDFSADCVNMVPCTDREIMKYILTLDELIDLIIPRGGEGLIRFVSENSRIPVIKHYKGVCHVYVDQHANLEKAHRVSLNSKVQRPGVCNAMETLLVHKKIADSFLPSFIKSLKEKNVIIHGSKEVLKYGNKDDINVVEEDNWYKEYLALEMNIGIVDDIQDAISHIQKYGSFHTESIITENQKMAEIFINNINSSAIMHNVSTRFNDGNELGLGAEIGISTTKLHAFGPMGLNELTSKKFVVLGDGQIK